MDKAYNPCAPLVEGALGAPERAVAAPVAGRPAVVRCDDDDGVLVLARLFERGHHLRELSASCFFIYQYFKDLLVKASARAVELDPHSGKNLQIKTEKMQGNF